MPDQKLSVGEESWQSISGRLGQVLDAADVGLWRFHLPSQLATWNAVAARIIGVDGQSGPAPLPIHPEDREMALSRLSKVQWGTGEKPVTLRLLRPDGVVRWIRASARPATGAEHESDWVVGIVSDVTAEVVAEASAEEGQRQLSTLINHLPGMAYRCELGEPWRMTYVSKGVELLTGFRAHEFTSGKLNWAGLMHPDDLPQVAAAVEDATREQASFDVTYRVFAADGGARWVQERGRAYYEDGTPRFLEGFIWDISAAKKAEEEARWIANHDPLTNLPNRLLFQETVDAKVQTGRQAAFSILLLDVDDFKRTNDTLGHDAGDRLLAEIGQRLRSTVRSEDFVARLGGDEFAIVLDAVTEPEPIAAIGQKILDALGAPFAHHGALLTCSASIGAGVFGLYGETGSELLKHADIALYAAKAAGRGNLKLFAPSMLNEIQVRNSMLALASSALQAENIVPHYQPKISLRTGEIAGFEALLRWKDGAGRLHYPNEITAAFDDPLLAIQLSDRMTSAVLADIRKWLDCGVSFNHVAINASPAQFRRGDFADRLLASLDTAGIATSFLQVEVTETVFLGRGSSYVERALETLDRAGVRIALDDFGTGYASLLHLAQYPVRMLKIDRSFVGRMISSSHDDAIIQAVVSLGHSLGMQVIAEGVETAGHEARLRAKGGDYAQGFLYARALAAEHVPAACIGDRIAGSM